MAQRYSPRRSLPGRQFWRHIRPRLGTRIVHHASIFEMNVESTRRRSAASRKAGKRTEPVTDPTS
jgi:hypothetical protein